jgi:[acyl-carrier-protein] S-malonyltransferase
MAVAFLFPGQGAQTVGMAADLMERPAVRELFTQAEKISGLPLARLCAQGPEEELARTDISQPAIFTVSMALLGELKSIRGAQAPSPAFCAGLSLGEYTALCAGGALSFEDGLRLVTLRGKLMQQAAQSGEPSGMVSLMGADEELARKVCQAVAKEGLLVPANFNCPGQIVLSGAKAACDAVVAQAASLGISGAVPLKVAGAFHSPFMQPAAQGLAQTLDGMEIRLPAVPVLSNVTGTPHENPSQIKKALLDQLTSPVRWQDNCQYLLAQGVQEFWEIGPGRVLAGLMRRIERKAKVNSINSLESLQKLGHA